VHQSQDTSGDRATGVPFWNPADSSAAGRSTVTPAENGIPSCSVRVAVPTRRAWNRVSERDSCRRLPTLRAAS
jgi:hypothetical protein